jgi:uncharacterized protein YdhG (YjbR/CyaY superfamily)
MQSNAESVDEYFTEVLKDRLEALKKIRNLCKTILKDYTESMEYGMPSYSKKEVEIAFASQKNYIALYILKKDVLDKYRHHFSKSAIGKGCIRYTHHKKIDFNLIESMIKDSFASKGPIC